MEWWHALLFFIVCCHPWIIVFAILAVSMFLTIAAPYVLAVTIHSLAFKQWGFPRAATLLFNIYDPLPGGWTCTVILPTMELLAVALTLYIRAETARGK